MVENIDLLYFPDGVSDGISSRAFDLIGDMWQKLVTKSVFYAPCRNVARQVIKGLGFRVQGVLLGFTWGDGVNPSAGGSGVPEAPGEGG